MSRSRALAWVWLVMSVLWVFAAAYQAKLGYPRIPLDMSATDAATRSVFDRAVTMHIVRWSIAAFVPPFAALAIGWFALRRSRAP